MQKDLFPKYLFLNEGSLVFDKAGKGDNKLYHLGMDMIRYGLEVTENYAVGTEEDTRQFRSFREQVKGVYEQYGREAHFHFNKDERNVCTLYPLLRSRRDGRKCMAFILGSIIPY